MADEDARLAGGREPMARRAEHDSAARSLEIMVADVLRQRAKVERCAPSPCCDLRLRSLRSKSAAAAAQADCSARVQHQRPRTSSASSPRAVPSGPRGRRRGRRGSSTRKRGRQRACESRGIHIPRGPESGGWVWGVTRPPGWWLAHCVVFALSGLRPKQQRAATHE